MIATNIALLSAFTTKLGFFDLAKGRYRPGLCKILLGIGGMAIAGYYVYNTCIQEESALPKESLLSEEDALSKDQITFLRAHKEEIEEMYARKTPVGNWSCLGQGRSKLAVVHHDFPGMLIKIPANVQGHRKNRGEDDLLLNHMHLKEVLPIAALFDRIAIPKSHLYKVSKDGLMIVEQRFNLADLTAVPNSPGKQKAIEQFNAFQKATHLDDLDPYSGHNAGIILPKTDPLKIGIIDFDCKETQDCQTIFVPSYRNLLILMDEIAIGIALGGVVRVAKAVAEKTYSGITDCLARAIPNFSCCC